MLKDKNRAKAAELVRENPTGELTDEQKAKLIADLFVAKQAYEAKAEAVKAHFKAVYEPMCVEKAELEIRMHELDLRVEQLKAESPAAETMVKAVLRAVNAKLGKKK